MNDLSMWFEQQHHGLHTFRSLQQKLSDLRSRAPEHSALCQLLSNLVSPYIEVYDEAPLPAADAARAHRRLAELLASIDLAAPAEQQLADFNRIARCDLVN
ncbi:hypothetical protein [Tardiphaga sp.]|jgi:hypothetical protein|uniref:hypothetical protein n=1 Tax=Tardiphaga sp. TaxID=1926292 RepID=UPI0037DA0C05